MSLVPVVGVIGVMGVRGVIGRVAVMRDEIVSPAGTTAYANQALEKGGFRNAVVNAVEAATIRLGGNRGSEGEGI